VADCVKVLDFGLVREYRADNPERSDSDGDNVIEGTPWFTPPEAIKGSVAIDQRSDLYSLGALGYYLLTGQYIFDAETVQEIHQKQLSADPIPPSLRIVNPVSSEIEQILLCCLEKDAGLRPQSAGELREQLLACSAAADWPAEARLAWWEAYRRKPIASRDETTSAQSAPLVTVRIDLESRIE
jgi:serine/threonine-protein kinase